MKDEDPDRHNAGVAQLVEHQPSKLNVAGSSLVSRSTENHQMSLEKEK